MFRHRPRCHCPCCLLPVQDGVSQGPAFRNGVFHLRKWWVRFNHSQKRTVPRHPLQPARDVVILGALHPFPPPQFIFTMLSFAIKARDFLCHSVQAVQRLPVRFFFVPGGDICPQACGCCSCACYSCRPHPWLGQGEAGRRQRRELEEGQRQPGSTSSPLPGPEVISLGSFFGGWVPRAVQAPHE